MPIYEYLCRDCNRIYSFYYATMTDAGAPTCPRCGATDLEREVSLFAFVRGGTDPLAAIPKSDDSEEADEEEFDAGSSEAPAGSGEPDTTPPVRDPGLYRQAWDGSYVRLRRREDD